MAAVVRQLLRPVPDEAAETNTKQRRRGEFLMFVTFSILGAVIEIRGNGGGNPHRLLDFSFVAIVFSLASSMLHLKLHCNLRLPLARLFLPLAAFFTAAAVVLLITSSISPSLRWVPFAVFFFTLLILGCFELFHAILHYVAPLRRSRFVVFLIGRVADDVDMWSSSNQLTPTSIDHEQRVDLHGEISETVAPADQLEIGMMGRSEPALHTPHST